MKQILIITLLFLSTWTTAQHGMLLAKPAAAGGAFSPADIDSLFYWWDASTGVTDTGGGSISDGEEVGGWADQSGNGYNLSQGTTNLYPIYRATGGPNSQPAIEFDGSNDYMSTTSHWWESDEISVFVVHKWTSATSGLGAIVSRYHDGGAARSWLLFGNSAAGSYRHNFNISPDGGTGSQTTWYDNADAKSTSYVIRSFLSTGSGTGGEMWVNGAERTATDDSVTTTYNSNNSTDVGAYDSDNTPTGYMGGSIAEIIIYSSFLSSTQRAQIEEYLNTKYSIY